VEVRDGAGAYRISFINNRLLNCPAECVSGIADWQKSNSVEFAPAAPPVKAKSGSRLKKKANP